MQNELDFIRTQSAPDQSHENQKLLNQINDLTKQNTKIKQELKDLQAKFDHQTVTI